MKEEPENVMHLRHSSQMTLEHVYCTWVTEKSDCFPGHAHRNDFLSVGDCKGEP